MEALIQLAWRTYGWNPETFHSKMQATAEAMKGRGIQYRFEGRKYMYRIYAD